MDTIKDFGSFPMGKGGECQVKITNFKGEYALDIRKWVETEVYTGPTKQGIRLNRAALDWLVQHDVINQAFITLDELES